MMSIYDEVFLWFLCGASFIIASIYTYARIKYHEVYITWVLLWWLLTVLYGTMIPMTKALRGGRLQPYLYALYGITFVTAFVILLVMNRRERDE